MRFQLLSEKTLIIKRRESFCAGSAKISAGNNPAENQLRKKRRNRLVIKIMR
jgi:hypothetical protein